RRKSFYNLAMVGLTRKRTELYHRIEARVDKMFADGLVEEVKSILDMGYDPKIKPLQSLGYKQVVEFLMGDCDLAEAIASTKKATRNYAKRQLTWFRRDDRINWFSLSEEGTQQILKRIALDICRSININVEYIGKD
ncbi:MAG TPA: tRNA (adenosine(37)-N6)-dimethylallyltransferase MiaA, partial [Syntrophaceticus sp.]|nr:tRNA (adenosine(37)-N6)-dimethylallyltransferase MiaA [Syntrophaceticus sp.]